MDKINTKKEERKRLPLGQLDSVLSGLSFHTLLTEFFKIPLKYFLFCAPIMTWPLTQGRIGPLITLSHRVTTFYDNLVFLYFMYIYHVQSACNVGNLGSLPGLGRFPWRRAWQPTPVFLPGESPWTEEPGRLQSMGSQWVGHDWATKHNTYHVLCPNPLSVVPGIKANACPLQYMIHHMKQTYLNQTLENQELDCADEELVSILICVSGFMFPTSLPSFWPRFLLWAYLLGPSANIILALTQIHCSYLFQLTRVSCFGLIYETWCVTKATLGKSQVGQVPRVTSNSPGCRQGHWVGQLEYAFTGSSIHHTACRECWGREQVQTGARVEPVRSWLVGQHVLLAPLSVNIP